MGFPSASCLFWRISYNLSQFWELQCRLPRAVWKGSCCFHFMEHKKKGELTKVVVSHHSENLLTTLWQKTEHGLCEQWKVTLWAPSLSTVGMTQAPAYNLLGIYWVIQVFKKSYWIILKRTSWFFFPIGGGGRKAFLMNGNRRTRYAIGKIIRLNLHSTPYTKRTSSFNINLATVQISHCSSDCL